MLHPAAPLALLMAAAMPREWPMMHKFLSRHVPRVDTVYGGAAWKLREEHGYYSCAYTRETDDAVLKYGAWLQTGAALHLAPTRPDGTPWYAAWGVDGAGAPCAVNLCSTERRAVVCRNVTARWRLAFEPVCRTVHNKDRSEAWVSSIHVYARSGSGLVCGACAGDDTIPVPIGTVDAHDHTLRLCGVWAGREAAVLEYVAACLPPGIYKSAPAPPAPSFTHTDRRVAVFSGSDPGADTGVTF